MRKFFKLSHLLALAVLALSACNLPVSGNTAQPTDPGAVHTAAAQTVQALQTQIAATSPATEEPTEAPSATEPVPPTAVIMTNTPKPVVVVPTATTRPVPCNRAGFVADVSVPDKTVFAPNAAFTKTWRLKNTGSCSWTTDYKLVFVNGDAMGGPAAVGLSKNINPGDTVDLSVNLKAPSSAKTYKGNWQLQNANGQNFGVGSSGDQVFWVEIVVGGTPSPSTPTYFAVTSITTTNTSSGDTCPMTITFNAKVTASKAGTVQYHWIDSVGNETDVTDLVFDNAGTKTIKYTMQYGAEGDGDVSGWAQVYVDQPNHQAFSKSNFDISCP